MEDLTAADGQFLMVLEDAFSIRGRGTVVAGRIKRGKVKVGEEVEIVSSHGTRKTVVTAIQMIQFRPDEGRRSDMVGLLLKGIDKNDVERGMMLAKPGSIVPGYQVPDGA